VGVRGLDQDEPDGPQTRESGTNNDEVRDCHAWVLTRGQARRRPSVEPCDRPPDPAQVHERGGHPPEQQCCLPDDERTGRAKNCRANRAGDDNW